MTHYESDLGQVANLRDAANVVNCPVCNKTLKPIGLSNHMKKMHSVKRNHQKIKCVICKKSVKASGIKDHLRVVHNKPND